MEILPAIDLFDSRVVRLSQGNYDQCKIYSDDPCEIAGNFATAGAGWIHVVDLNAARGDGTTNCDEIQKIRQFANDSGMKVQLGGGARDEEKIRYMLDCLADRVVVGSAAVKNWKWFELLISSTDIAAKIALGLDARDGLLAAEGWTQQLSEKAVDFARRVSGSSLGAIVYTDIARDGMLTGFNIKSTAELITATDVPVIASGGISSLDDVTECGKIGCAGLIIGKAYYEGKVDLSEACALAEKN